MRLEMHVHHHDWRSEANAKELALLRSRVEFIITRQELIMHTLDEVLAEVTNEQGEIASITTLINGLRQQVTDALAGQTIPPPVQAKVDAIFAAAVANNAAIAQALADPGQPPAPPATEPAPLPSAGPPNPPVAEPSTDAGVPQPSTDAPAPAGSQPVAPAV
jgi:hypothetical protein